MKNKIIAIIENSLKQINSEEKANVVLTEPKGHGDFSTNIAMQIAQQMKSNPISIAQKIKENINSDLISNVEVAKPGFINIFLSNNILKETVSNIIKQGKDFGRGNNNLYINVEYVSANPTGYLHLGHARGAAIGSALVNILKFAGNRVDSEYYINDVGNQIDLLGISTFVRYQNALGNNDLKLPENSYKGEDIKKCAKFLINKFGDKYKDVKYEEVSNIFKNEAKQYMLDFIKKHLGLYNVKIDKYFSEASMYEGDKIQKTLTKIKDHTFEEDGALWINTKANGDDKNRVLVKSDKTLTYFTPDLVYHNSKVERGYDELIDIWGGDHIGYIKRMEIGLNYLGLKDGKLDILVVQTVRLIKNNKEFKMSKRKGTVFTLEEIIEEVGTDVARWFMLNRSINSQFVFDINEVLKKSSDNPIFTVKYTHARIHQLIKKSSSIIEANEYQEKKEIKIIIFLDKFPEIISNIAKNHKVHFLTKYLLDLCSLFNSWYSTTKAIGNTREASLIALAIATQIVIKNGLNLLGIIAPNKM